MSKKYYKMNAAELAVFLSNFNTVADLNKSELNITSATLVELQAVKADLDARLTDRQAKQEAAIAATTALNQAVKTANSLIGSVNISVKSNKTVSASLIEALGLDANDDSFTTNVPVAPTDLIVEGRSNGINYIKWNAGGNKPRTTFILEAKTGNSADYAFVKALTKTRYEHKNQTPGVRVFYRVKAVSGDLESAYSNEAVVYN